MTIKSTAELSLLCLVVLSCWLGALGMWRMRLPIQSLHYASLPAIGTVALTIAVFLKTGWGVTGWKTLLLSCAVFGINSVGAHATARAIRTRELGHWEPMKGDPIEFTRDFKDGRNA